MKTQALQALISQWEQFKTLQAKPEAKKQQVSDAGEAWQKEKERQALNKYLMSRGIAKEGSEALALQVNESGQVVWLKEGTSGWETVCGLMEKNIIPETGAINKVNQWLAQNSSESVIDWILNNPILLIGEGIDNLFRHIGKESNGFLIKNWYLSGLDFSSGNAQWQKSKWLSVFGLTVLKERDKGPKRYGLLINQAALVPDPKGLYHMPSSESGTKMVPARYEIPELVAQSLKDFGFENEILRMQAMVNNPKYRHWFVEHQSAWEVALGEQECRNEAFFEKKGENSEKHFFDFNKQYQALDVTRIEGKHLNTKLREYLEKKQAERLVGLIHAFFGRQPENQTTAEPKVLARVLRNSKSCIQLVKEYEQRYGQDEQYKNLNGYLHTAMSKLTNSVLWKIDTKEQWQQQRELIKWLLSFPVSLDNETVKNLLKKSFLLPQLVDKNLVKTEETDFILNDWFDWHKEGLLGVWLNQKMSMQLIDGLVEQQRLMDIIKVLEPSWEKLAEPVLEKEKVNQIGHLGYGNLEPDAHELWMRLSTVENKQLGIETRCQVHKDVNQLRDSLISGQPKDQPLNIAKQEVENFVGIYALKAYAKQWSQRIWVSQTSAEEQSGQELEILNMQGVDPLVNSEKEAPLSEDMRLRLEKHNQYIEACLSYVLEKIKAQRGSYAHVMLYKYLPIEQVESLAQRSIAKGSMGLWPTTMWLLAHKEVFNNVREPDDKQKKDKVYKVFKGLAQLNQTITGNINDIDPVLGVSAKELLRNFVGQLNRRIQPQYQSAWSDWLSAYYAQLDEKSLLKQMNQNLSVDSQTNGSEKNTKRGFSL